MANPLEPGEPRYSIGELASGSVVRLEPMNPLLPELGSRPRNVIVELERGGEGVLPRAEWPRSESHDIGSRVRALVIETGPPVVLSRKHADLVRRLFELMVPDIANGTIRIRAVAREAGFRSKVALESDDPRIDCVAAAVGHRGMRIQAIIAELNGERVDVFGWSDDPETLLRNALKPAEVARIEIEWGEQRAVATVTEENLSSAIGRQGQNVRLASRLTGWEIDVITANG